MNLTSNHQLVPNTMQGFFSPESPNRTQHKLGEHLFSYCQIILQFPLVVICKRPFTGPATCSHDLSQTDFSPIHVG